jgi:phosphoglycerol transferase MdoB-like AlkP superfamily enzyme
MLGGANGTFEKTKVDKTFKIPAIIYCPELFKPEKSNKLGSQVDIVPTIMDVLNIKSPYSSLGRSLFSKSKNRFVFLSSAGEQVYLINNDGVVEQDWKVDGQSASVVDIREDNARLLFALEKAIYDLVAKDRWYDRKSLDVIDGKL